MTTLSTCAPGQGCGFWRKGWRNTGVSCDGSGFAAQPAEKAVTVSGCGGADNTVQVLISVHQNAANQGLKSWRPVVSPPGLRFANAVFPAPALSSINVVLKGGFPARGWLRRAVKPVAGEKRNAVWVRGREIAVFVTLTLCSRLSSSVTVGTIFASCSGWNGGSTVSVPPRAVRRQNPMRRAIAPSRTCGHLRG
jgi:hypothetical protein